MSSDEHHSPRDYEERGDYHHDDTFGGHDYVQHETDLSY